MQHVTINTKEVDAPESKVMAGVKIAVGAMAVGVVAYASYVGYKKVKSMLSENPSETPAETPDSAE